MTQGTKLSLIDNLTSENFAQFGDVIEVTDTANHFSINDGFAERYHDLANIDVNDDNGRTLINIFRSTPLEQPIKIEKMERHPLSSQAFIPLGNNPYLVVVAPEGDFDESEIKVFLAESNQGVNYRSGVWHHFCLALYAISDFLVIDRGGEGENCDFVTLDEAKVISLTDEEKV